MAQRTEQRADAAGGQPGREQHQGGSRDRPAEGDVSPWEWAVATLGLILILGMLGFMLYRALTTAGAPPAIDFAIDDIQPAGEGYLVTFTATNRGDEAAADLLIEGESRGADGDVETSSATLAYLPGGSQRRGGLYFSADPRTRRLTLRPKGYERP